METPTLEPSGGVTLPAATPPNVIGKGADEKDKVVEVLTGYFNEAQNNRRSGLNPRDDKWSENLNLYWNRVDFSKKAAWQARETMPEVPTFVDRFAAALKEALISTPDSFYTIIDPADENGTLAQAIKRMTDMWLSIAGRNQVGQLLPFSAVFEEQMTMGALMATSSITTWKNDVPMGRVAVETVDPRFVWLDHTYRNLYRIRRVELDLHELSAMLNMKDSANKNLFNIDEIAKLVGELSQDESKARQETSGSGDMIMSNRKPVVLDEYIATIVGTDGKLIADRALIVLANGKYIVRGPEPNPFWHERDWLIYAPLVTAPLSVYGRSYMEDFGSVSKTFTELTNMILDAVHTTSLKAYAVVPGMLLNPNQIAEGLSPNKMFLLEDGYKASDFAQHLDLGTLPAESVMIWKALKAELSEAAMLNEIGIGQFAPKGRTSATEITETQQSSSALLRSVAQTVETRYLDPTLDLVWKTGLQHVSPKDTKISKAVGDDMFQALIANRKELIKRPLTFQARGISQLIQRSQMLKSLFNILGVIAQNDILLKEFLASIDVKKFVNKLFELSNIDLTSVRITEQEKMIRSITEPLQAVQENVAGAAAPSPQGAGEVKNLVSSMGVGR